MGLENCKTEKNLSTQPSYYFKQLEYDINSGQGDQGMKELCKVEVKIENISSGSCQIRLVQYTDNTRKTILKNEGETEMAKVNSATNSIIFNKFFILNYFFEKEQPIDFIINGSINGKVSTTLPSIMGSRGQRLVRPIDGGNEAKLEMKGFAYKNKDSSSYYFKVNASGNFNVKGINYTIKSLGSMTRPQNNILYKSEILNPKLKNPIEFGVTRIPDLFLCPDNHISQ